jgi:probable HAF family extracellular repeat protein
MSQSIRLTVITLLMLLVTPLAAGAQATPGYTIHQIKFPGAETTWAYGINDRKGAGGDVVGLYSMAGGDVRGFMRWGSTYLDFTLPEGVYHSPHAVNNARVIVGNYNNPVGEIHAFVHVGASKEHTTWSLEHVDVPGARLTHAKGINEEGHVVGAYYLPGEERARAFLLIEETYHDIEATFGPPPGMEIINIWAEDVSAIGIVGTLVDPNGIYYGWTLINGVYDVFTVPGAYVYSIALDMNDKGQVVGQYSTPEGGLRGFLYKNGTFKNIDAAKDAATSPQSINNHGHIAGILTRWHSDDFEDHTTIGFLAVPKPVKTPAKVVQR